jgi:PAS domain S-box-containing protein
MHSVYQIHLRQKQDYSIYGYRNTAAKQKTTKTKLTRQAVKLLQESEERYRNLANSLPEIIFESDVSGNVLFGNKRGFEITGYTEDDFAKGINIFNLIAPQDRERAIEDFKRTLSNQPSESSDDNEFTVTKKDGTTFPAIIITSLIIANKHPIGIRGIVIDITERKKMENALRKSRKKYQDLIETANDFIWEIDPQGRYTYCSTQIEKLWGLKPADMIGKTPFDLMPPDEKEQALSAFMATINSPRPINGMQTTSYDSKGRLIFLEINVVPFFDDKGKLRGFRGISRDITERKKLEKTLQDKERLAAIGQTAGMVGHDIRNPLQAMTSDVYLLKRELSSMPECETCANQPNCSGFTAKQGILESLQSLEDNIGYINKIVADLQDYARPLKPEIVRVPNLCEVIAKYVDNIIIPSNIMVSQTCSTNLPTVKLDLTFLKRILTNLATNAVQAMPSGGKLTINTHSKADKLIIDVEDTGVGIPDEVKPKLFKPMTSTKAKGQGLGLSVVKRLVEAQNGSINFESKVGNGTKFRVELPIGQ